MERSSRMKEFIKHISSTWSKKEKDNFYKSVELLEKIVDICWFVVIITNPFVMMPVLLCCIGIFSYGIINIMIEDCPKIYPIGLNMEIDTWFL